MAERTGVSVQPRIARTLTASCMTVTVAYERLAGEGFVTESCPWR
jgi:hypothetical protein